MFLAAATLLTFASCVQQSKFDELDNKYKEMEKEYGSLKEEERLVKGEYSETIETLNSIEDTLRVITEREAKIANLAKQTESGDLSTRERIMSQINALRQANLRSKDEARSLRSKVAKFKVENEELKKMISIVEAKLDQKEKELQEANVVIDDLKGTLGKLEGQLLEKSGELEKAYGELKTERDNLTQKVADLEKRDNFISDCGKAYVVCGDRKALRRADIIVELGKALTKGYKEKLKGMGSTINYFDNNIISCDGGTIKEVLPARPADSYKINGNKVEVLNNEKFWATDKTVVLVKD